MCGWEWPGPQFSAERLILATIKLSQNYTLQFGFDLVCWAVIGIGWKGVTRPVVSVFRPATVGLTHASRMQGRLAGHLVVLEGLLASHMSVRYFQTAVSILLSCKSGKRISPLSFLAYLSINTPCFVVTYSSKHQWDLIMCHTGRPR